MNTNSSFYYSYDFENFFTKRPDSTKPSLKVCKNIIDYSNPIYASNTDLTLTKLVLHYSKLSNILDTLTTYDNTMFYSFAYLSHCLFYVEQFNRVLEMWDDLFSVSLEEYYTDCHPYFSETFGKTYVHYFNMKFPTYLYKNRTVVYYNTVRKYHFDYLTYINDLVISDHYLLEEMHKYQIDFDQELEFQSFSPLLLTKS